MKVTVVTRTKNRPLLLPRALRSIAAQTHKNIEWIIVNDGGDRSPVEEILQAAASENIKCTAIDNPKSLGMEAASNVGVKNGNGELVAIHDDDDSWHDSFLSSCVAFLTDNTHYLGVVTHCQRVVETIDEDGSICIAQTEQMNPGLVSIQLGVVAQKNQFPPISFVFRRAAYDKIGGFDETMPVLGDWDFNLRLLMEGDIGVIARPLANQHVRSGLSVSEDYGNTITAGVARHHEWEAIYRNRRLREDLDNNAVGLGVLLGVASQSEALRLELERLRVSSWHARLHAKLRSAWSFIRL